MRSSTGTRHGCAGISLRSRSSSRADPERLLLGSGGGHVPASEGIAEGAIAGNALLQSQNGAAAIVVEDGHVDPSALLQELDVPAIIRRCIGQTDQEEAIRHLHR